MMDSSTLGLMTVKDPDLTSSHGQQQEEDIHWITLVAWWLILYQVEVEVERITSVDRRVTLTTGTQFKWASFIWMNGELIHSRQISTREKLTRHKTDEMGPTPEGKVVKLTGMQSLPKYQHAEIGSVNIQNPKSYFPSIMTPIKTLNCIEGLIILF